MPKSRIMIQLEPETIEQVDKIRGAVPRAAWVRLLIEDRLREPHIDNWDEYSHFMMSPHKGKQASVSQQEENLKPGDERSNRSRRAGKGSPTAMGLREAKEREAMDTDHDPLPPPKSPSRKPKACKHTNQIRKLGAAFCTDCGEFV